MIIIPHIFPFVK